MTPPDNTPQVEVTQADREAYLSLNMLPEFDAIDVRAGRWDHVTGVQAFARHRLSATPPAQTALVEALCKLWTPPEEAWAGLARALMMAFDMNCKTPRQIFQHLERTGKAIPQWLRDEPEMKHLDHVPSKGTRAVIIYRAMLEPTLSAISLATGERS